MNLEQILLALKSDAQFLSNVTRWEVIPPRPAQFAPFPEWLDPRLIGALKARGVSRLYTHQRQALELSGQGKDFVVVTPTASGKTLCYNLPVLGEILKNPDARALYLFPTKALSADQAHELYELVNALGMDIKAFTYDGDTAATARKAVRQAGHIVVTNPDMLHSGILPLHTKWVKLFENLKYIVIDELHMYRGVFGSHLANVLRRLDRICAFYGSRPQFICCSATIANPKELTRAVVGRDAELIDQNGAPSGERNIIFYNPPVVNRQLGIRKSAVLQARLIAARFISNRVQTIVFARSRLVVEVLTTYLKKLVRGPLGNDDAVMGYRGGYLPLQRRGIEKGLRDGSIIGVVSTNALELGIDIGRLEACVLCGYPGTIASTWQQSGRAGRRNTPSCVVLVATSAAMDQFIIAHPEYFLSAPPESALINPDNLYILLSHIKCAAYELPFADGEDFGVQTTEAILSYLEEQGVIRHVGNRWHWSTEDFPASDISLRSASNDNFVIIDISQPSHRVIGEMDRYTVPMLLHEKAVYMHQGLQYQVEKLDFTEKKGYIRRVDADYYTDASLSVSHKVLDVLREDEQVQPPRYCGEVKVTALVTMFKKIKFDTHENLGWGEVNLPELDLHTTAYWTTMPEKLVEGLSQSQLQSAMTGIANLLAQAAPLYLMCDPKDIHVLYEVRSTFTRLPTFTLYDATPGGVGLADKAYEMHLELFSAARSMLDGCPCENGCPSCIGPSGEEGVKKLTRGILEVLIDGGFAQPN